MGSKPRRETPEDHGRIADTMREDAASWKTREAEATSRSSRWLARLMRRYTEGGARYFDERSGREPQDR